MSVHSHKAIFGYRMIAYSSVAIALFGFLVWGHHMFTSGMAEVTTIIFSALTFTVSIPSAIKVFKLALYDVSRNRFLGYTDVVRIGILVLVHHRWFDRFVPRIAINRPPSSRHLLCRRPLPLCDDGWNIDCLLGRCVPLVAKMIGKMYNELGGQISAVIVFIGFNLTFLPQFVMGSRGMPRRYAQYDPEFQFLHQVSTVGAFVLGLGLFVAAGVLLSSLFRGRKAPANPWGGDTWNGIANLHLHSITSSVHQC